MKTQNIKPIKKLLPAILLFPTLITGFFFRSELVSFLSILQDHQAISAYIQNLGLWGPILLFALLVGQVFLAMIPGHALMMAGGYVYGPFVAVFITSTSTILGSQVAFWLARRFGVQLINRMAKPEKIERWNNLSARQGPLFYFFSFVLPIFPSDLMCYIAGLGKVSPKGFLFANISGRTICAVTLTMIGVMGFTPPWQFWVLVVGCLGGFFISWKIYMHKNDLPYAKSKLAHALGMWIMTTYRQIFRIKLCVKGLENLPPGPKILAANHPNVSDAFLLPLLFDGHIRAIAQASQFHQPIIGWIFKNTGQIPVIQGCKAEAFQQGCQALKDGENVLVFPEGRLNPDNEPVKTGTGAVRMALQSGAPIIPIGIYVPEKHTLNLSHSLKDNSLRKLWQIRGKFNVRIGKPWSPKEENTKTENPVDVHELTHQLMEKINTMKFDAIEESKNENSYS